MVSQSLLNAIKVEEKVSSNFCLGLTDWCSCESCIASRSSMEHEDKPTNVKRAKLSLTRFSTSRSDEEMTEISKGKRSANTQRSTTWVVKAFREWVSERNSKYPEDQVPEDFLHQNFTQRHIPLNHWLSHFVVKSRRQDGNKLSASYSAQPSCRHSSLHERTKSRYTGLSF